MDSTTTWARGKCIGKGSFGIVSLAVSKSPRRRFAVKSVDRSLCSPSQLECLENEIRVLRSLSSSSSSPHPFVVEYLGDDVTGPFRNLHMEYLPGGTVAAAAAACGLDERLVGSYARCAASALGFLHSNGIVHCDVKGRNVLIGVSTGTAKLADFGSAIEISGREGKVSPRGSPLWMAPEVVRGESQGPESDVWSLGCTVIEMLTGGPAWEDRGADTLRRIGFSDELPEFPARLSESGRDFLDKCLRRDPAERWSSDRLLQHPFLAPYDKTIDSSPRCVLDWLSSDSFEDKEEEEEEDDERTWCPSPNPNPITNLDQIGVVAKNRIERLLSSNCGAIWESDGWETVRSRCDHRAEMREDEDRGEGTSWEFGDLIRTVEEGNNNWEEYHYNWSRRRSIISMEWPYDNCGGSLLGWSNAGLSCSRHGRLTHNDSAVAVPFYSCCTVLCYCYLNFIIKYSDILFYFSLLLSSFTFHTHMGISCIN